MHSASEILAILDAASFPALDNGYIYPAAARLSLFRSSIDWSMVIETFGFSPRHGVPSIYIDTFGSRLHNRKQAKNYVSEDAYQNYLRNHPHDEFQSFEPIENGAWNGEDELVSDAPDIELIVRGKRMRPPSREAYRDVGIELSHPDRVYVFELARFLAAVAREDVLATLEERQTNVPADLQQVLLLDEWHHPDIVGSEQPSDLESFRQLAAVLETGDTSIYHPSTPPNTHWKHWPEGGTL